MTVSLGPYSESSIDGTYLPEQNVRVNRPKVQEMLKSLYKNRKFFRSVVCHWRPFSTNHGYNRKSSSVLAAFLRSCYRLASSGQRKAFPHRQVTYERFEPHIRLGPDHTLAAKKRCAKCVLERRACSKLTSAEHRQPAENHRQSGKAMMRNPFLTGYLPGI